MPEDTEPIGDCFWGALAARVLHPVQVEIIEALWRIDRPLSATDLLQVFDAKPNGLRIEHHLRRLTRLDALALEGNGRARAPMGQHSYRLVKRPRS